METIMKLHPTVCAVGKNYQIMIVTECEALIGVRVGEKTYYHHSNGIRISAPGVHKFIVPISELDMERNYTVIAQEMIERTPYYPKVGAIFEKQYKFSPVDKTENINIYHMSDVHGKLEQAINIVKFWDDRIDLLIMNGDIQRESNTFDDVILCYKIASEVTKGEIPCIISRGNHDMRGVGAQQLASYMPGDDGKSYYTFRLGCIWGILVDAGEDKNDRREEYNGVICCHEFRMEQEDMIKETIKNASSEYDENGVEYKMVISHVPFTFKKREDIFDIERELFSDWSTLLRENIKPDFMLCGHTHKICVSENGSEYDLLGQPCTIVVAGGEERNETNEVKLVGSLINLHKGTASIKFNTEKELREESIIKFEK